MLSLSPLKHRLMLAAKKCLFFGRGEPYRIGDRVLRFVPGTRPVRLRYQSSKNGVNRYDALQLAWMLNNLADGDLAIDVGANCGQCTLVMAEKCGSRGTVIAFEPNPAARSILERNLDLNPSITRATVECFACSDVSGGETEFYRNRNSSYSSLVPFFSDDLTSEGEECFRVPLTNLDTYLAQRRLPEPRLVKIDTEGAEIRILHGARTLLLSNADILCELHPYAWPQFGNSLQELKDVVAEGGRRMRYLDEDGEIAGDVHYGIVALERVR
jgi:FkbM family methyltransferase